MSAVQVAAAERTARSGTAEVRPDGVVPLRRAGADPLRVLAFGGGTLAGWGLLDHDRGLAGQLADRLALRTSRGIDLDVIVDVDPAGPASGALLRGLRIGRYDAVVAVLGERAAMDHAPRGTWLREVEALLRLLREQMAGTAPLVVVDSARSMASVSAGGLKRHRAMTHAGRLTQTTRLVAEDSRARFVECAVPENALDWGRQFSTAVMKGWADEIVSVLLPDLPQPGTTTTATLFRGREHDEGYRQRAVDSMRLRTGTRDALLDAVAAEARREFSGMLAAVTVVDGPHVWAKASSSSRLATMNRAGSFCDLAVRGDSILIVPDAADDPRFPNGAPVLAGQEVRFYAGEPVRSMDGYRIGALCVFGAEARVIRPRQLDGLHALVGRVERELWAQTLSGAR